MISPGLVSSALQIRGMVCKAEPVRIQFKLRKSIHKLSELRSSMIESWRKLSMVLKSSALVSVSLLVPVAVVCCGGGGSGMLSGHSPKAIWFCGCPFTDAQTLHP